MTRRYAARLTTVIATVFLLVGLLSPTTNAGGQGAHEAQQRMCSKGHDGRAQVVQVARIA